ncbi:MAG: hypothetical protein M0P43_09190 [Arcobacteraceae bacterium]|nr:hypothetical protein [Arcobacteraceae bacterium]MDY0328685.1 hypothetical protein [Arcobacteraceae bacterium]
MLPVLPFLAGAAIGVAGVMIYGNKKTVKTLLEGKKYVETKVLDGKEFVEEKFNKSKDTVEALGECVKDKITKKRTSKKIAKVVNNEPEL